MIGPTTGPFTSIQEYQNRNKEGTLIIYSVKPGSDRKVVLELAQRIVTPKSTPFSRLNESDPKFKKPKPVKSWLAVEPDLVCEHVPNLQSVVDKVREYNRAVPCNILDPVIDGFPLRLQIVESTQDELYKEYYRAYTTSSRRREIEYLFQNYETTAKRKGKWGNFVVGENRALVFREVFVTYGQKEHKFIIQQGSIIFAKIPNFGVDLVDPVVIEERTLIKK